MKQGKPPKPEEYNTKNFSLVLVSEKGAGLYTDGNVEFWVAPKTSTAFTQGKVTPAFVDAYRRAGVGNTTPQKKEYYRAAIAQTVRETEKAYLFRDFSGNQAWFPKTAVVFAKKKRIRRTEFVYVAAWAMKGKEFQHKHEVEHL